MIYFLTKILQILQILHLVYIINNLLTNKKNIYKIEHNNECKYWNGGKDAILFRIKC